MMNQKIKQDHKLSKNWLFWLPESQHVALYIWWTTLAPQQAKYQGEFCSMFFFSFQLENSEPHE